MTIDRLYRLSVAIRRPSIVNQNVKAANFQIKDEEGNECGDAFYNYALEVVAHKCQHADQPLRETLARAITLRRKRFLYRRKHQEKLSFKDESEDEESSPKSISKDEGVPITPHRDSPKGPKDTEAGKLLAGQRPPPSHTSASMFSKTRFDRVAILDSTSIVTTTVKNAPSEHIGNVQVPPPPKMPSGSKEFECPYCFLVVGISEAKPAQWRYVRLPEFK